ncbi:ATP-binding protein [Candidatus Poribacteria bacterium]|nr:ATP-binding protein [Candidatus Poribacteria bacterium]
MLINRVLSSKIENILLKEPKVIILYGPRQAGKTTLIHLITSKIDKKLYFVGDDLYAQNLFRNNELEALKRVIGDNKILIIDEAQRIDNIGLTLKILIDSLPVTIFVSGSASFDLANKINEPLTGRTKTFLLYPLSYQEVSEKYRQTSNDTAIGEMLRFGMYPKVHTFSSDQEKQDYLYEYINNYLYKDVLMFEDIRKPKKVIDLLTLLALQIGKEVAISELAQNLSMSQKAVLNYLDVLEKMFVIINLRGFSRNLRKEISKTSKYYFMDVGVRNALIRNFNELKLRADAGDLFENWFIIEKYKLSGNLGKPANFYFWRTYDQQEIDLIEERDGKLTGFECKFSPKKELAAPKDWINTYPNSSFETINSNNYFKHLVL